MIPRVVIELFVVIAILFTTSGVTDGVLVHHFISNALGSHMVLQRGPQQANIWGWTKQTGVKVVLLFNGKSYTTTSTTNGAWSILLDPTGAGGPYEIHVNSSMGESAVLTDVLFGDVFVCSGQSNMQFTVLMAFNGSEEASLANLYPYVRLFTVGTFNYSTTPWDELQMILQPWSVASASTVGYGDWSAFSAACWFFGRDLYDAIKVPIGLFSDNWGGTPVQAWSSPDALAKCPSPMKTLDQSGGPNDPSQLWNSMIVPILPMTISGALWYQGESNAWQYDYYACAFPAMISDWRAKWGGTTSYQFTFMFVQLAPWNSTDHTSEPLIRLSQMYATLLPFVGVATAMDWGDPSSPYDSIHPRYKQIVGQRLQLVALGLHYGEMVQYKGPEAVEWTVVSDAPKAEVSVSFEPSSLGSGLQFVPKWCDPLLTVDQCGWFDLGTSDGKWTNASAIIQGSTLVISSTLGSNVKVTGVRYGWANFPVATLYNKEGLPALPFVFPNPIQPVRGVVVNNHNSKWKSQK